MIKLIHLGIAFTDLCSVNWNYCCIYFERFYSHQADILGMLGSDSPFFLMIGIPISFMLHRSSFHLVVFQTQPLLERSMH